MKNYQLPTIWDARKFAARYGLSSIKPDFCVEADGTLTVYKNLPDDPPIFDPPDPIIPPPAGVYVHEMKELTKKVGNKLLDGAGTTAYYIVVDTETKLSDPWFAGIFIDIGSSAYVMDKAKTLIWDGIKWK